MIFKYDNRTLQRKEFFERVKKRVDNKLIKC